MIDALRKIYAIIVALLLIAIGVGLQRTGTVSLFSDPYAYPELIRLLWQHLYLVGVSMAIATVIGLTVGIVLTRPKFRSYTGVVMYIVSLGQTIPSLAVLALVMTFLGIGAKSAHGKFVLLFSRSERGARVFCHAEVIENQAYIAGELSHFLSHATHVFGLDHSNGESAESSHVFRTIARANPAAVFVVVPVDNVMTAILDAPMAAVRCKNTSWASFLGRLAGDAISCFTRALAGLFIYAVTLNHESLCNAGKV